jgi:hypothetical protein
MATFLEVLLLSIFAKIRSIDAALADARVFRVAAILPG